MEFKGLKIIKILRILFIANITGTKQIGRYKLLKAAGYSGGGYQVLSTLENEGIIEITKQGDVKLTKEGLKELRKLFPLDYILLAYFPLSFILLSIPAFVFLLLTYNLSNMLKPTTTEEIAAICYIILPNSLRFI